MAAVYTATPNWLFSLRSVVSKIALRETGGTDNETCAATAAEISDILADGREIIISFFLLARPFF